MKFARQLLKLNLNLIFVTVFAFSQAHANKCVESVKSKFDDHAIHLSYEKLRTSDSWLKSHIFSLHHLKVLKENLNYLSKLDIKFDPALDNPRFNQLLKRTIINPKHELSASEIHFLAQNTTYQNVFQKTLQVLLVFEGLYKSTLRINHYFEGRASAIQITKDRGIYNKIKTTLRATFNGPLRFLVPVIYLPKINSKLDEVFVKQFKNPNFEPSPEEMLLLRQYKAEEIFLQKKEFMQSHASWTQFRKWLGRVSLVTVTALNISIVGNWALHLSKPDAFVSAEQFFEAPEYRLKSNQVRIYNETVPFPHMAIEIDGRVYSYGQTHMTVKPTREYLLSQKINAALQQNLNTEKPGSLTFDNSVKLTGLDNISRSVQAVTLNLPESEKANLRRYLELQTGNRYHNFTLAMDCATMIVQALERQTGVRVPGIQGTPLTIDASPSLVMMYLGLLKTVESKNSDGNKLVEDINQIAMAEQLNRDKHFFRGLYINAMETKFFTHFFHYNFVVRSYLQARYGSDNFSFLQPQVRKEIESWHSLVVQDFKSGESPVDAQLLVFIDEASRIGQTPIENRDFTWERNKNQLIAVAEPFIQEAIKNSQAEFDSKEMTFADIIRSGYRMHIYLGVKKHIEDLLLTGSGELDTGNPEQILRKIR